MFILKKKTIWLVVIVACLFSFISYKMSSQSDTVAGYDKQVLTGLLGKFDIGYKDLDQAVADTQKEFLRQPDKEYCELEKIHEDQRDNLLPYFDKLGLIKAWKPTRSAYDYAIVLGSTYSSMKNRLEYFAQLYNSGISVRKIVFLVGQRDLDYAKDLQELQETGIDITHLKTETDLAVYLYNTLITQHPELKAIPVDVIDTLKQSTENGGMRRPNTADTVRTWFNQANPQPGICLVVSSQPFCNYQDVTCKILLPGTFVVETVGASDNSSSPVFIYLDTIARTLYQYKNGQQIIYMPSKQDRPVKFNF